MNAALSGEHLGKKTRCEIRVKIYFHIMNRKRYKPFVDQCIELNIKNIAEMFSPFHAQSVCK